MFTLYVKKARLSTINTHILGNMMIKNTPCILKAHIQAYILALTENFLLILY